MATQAEAPTVEGLRDRLDGLTLRDRSRLGRRLDRLRNDRDRDKLVTEIEKAEVRVARRRAVVPEQIPYPDLPVTARREDIATAIAQNQVVIVAGETGSGKTTQLPKICLELGRGVAGLIGHTQPRRLAARTVADRIAEELGTELGTTVGFKVRFTDQSTDDTLVKLMTDGILLAEMQGDRDLLAYDTIILDEAHERSLNVDFLLGYLKTLLPRRPDLKLIITSATIETDRFSRHFDDAPVIEVTGRTYPVEVRYRPPAEDDDPVDAIRRAVDELCGEGPGDILVFLSGEREIRDTADALGDDPRFDVLPLYARLSAADQHRVFAPHPGRRVVLATNVAETSLTVPGIRYVIDPGTARISRYSRRLKVQRLPIEAVSQASANQRKGRCGRVAEGVCIRLYSEEDFESRPEFTDPEILRTNLASVILQMTALGLGDVAAFPFVDPPDRRNIRDGIQLLGELGALVDGRLTDTGRTLARLPLDPRMARMVLEADRNGCLREVLVIAAALSIQDPRERPVDNQQHADELHLRFVDPHSDFLTYLNLWNYVRDQQRELSSSAFRRLCRSEFLHYLRVREWQDLHSQLKQVSRGLGFAVGDANAHPDAVHKALLAGLLSHIGLRDEDKRDYLGARGARFALWPGSVLAKKKPAFVMAAELVETSRLWGRVGARIDPEWAEELAPHLVTRVYSEPHWSKGQAAVMAFERVTLYGVPIVTQRKVNYARVDPEMARDLFLRQALVEGNWSTHHQFFAANRALLDDLSDAEHRTRRRDLVIDDQTLYDFYDDRIPEDVVSGRHFDAWWKQARREDPDRLTFTRAALGGGEVDPYDYPDVWQLGDLVLPVTYKFEPGAADDGVTVRIPLAVLNQVPVHGFEWQVPGLREELVTELIRSLPKPVRVRFVPAPDHARAVLSRVDVGEEPLLDALERELQAMTGTEVTRDEWQLGKVPTHLRMRFAVTDDGGKEIATGRDLGALKRKLAPKVSGVVAAAAPGLEVAGLKAWPPAGELPRFVERTRAGHVVRAYPALVDEGASVAVRVLATEAEQSQVMWAGTRRLLLLALPSPVKAVQDRLSNASKLALARAPHGNVAALLDDCVAAAVDGLVAENGGPAWDAAGFDRLREAVRARLDVAVLQIVTDVEQALRAAQDVEKKLKGRTSLDMLPALSDLQAQVGRLVFAGFVSAVGGGRLPDLVRYLRAAEVRLDKLARDPRTDRALMVRVQHVQSEYDAARRRIRPTVESQQALTEARWLIEELRVSLFAQQLGTRGTVSEVRILRALDALT